MLFKKYCEFLEGIEEESSRTEITKMISALLSDLKETPEDLEGALYMMKGNLTAEYKSLETNFSDKLFVNVVEDFCKLNAIRCEVKKIYKQKGDVGDMIVEVLEKVPDDVESLKLEDDQVGLALDDMEGDMKVREGERVEPEENRFASLLKSPRSVKKVYDYAVALAKLEGSGSQKHKQQLALKAVLSLTKKEAKYFSRIITGDLRLGVSDKTILDGISWAKVGDKSMRKSLDKAFGNRADIAHLARHILVDERSADEIEVQVGVPMAAQLVEREKDAEAIVKRMGTALIQPKYDGLRAQLHMQHVEKSANGGVKDEATNDEASKEEGTNDEGMDKEKEFQVSIYSRNMTALTDMFPDLVKVFQDQPFESIILDGEVIGYDETTDSFLPFQETIQRKRKYKVEELAESVPIKYFVFDLLYLDGEDLTEKPLEARLEQLNKIKWHGGAKQRIEIVKSPAFSDAKSLEEYFRDMVDKGLEGVIAKDPKSPYSPGKRGYDWIKLKPNTFSDMKDTVDAVVMGYYRGKGSRAKFGIGGFLVGVYDSEDGRYKTLAKVGSGVKEDEWPKFKEILDEHTANDKPKLYDVNKELAPDVYVYPEVVIEIDADEISKSQNHTLGYSLRFPRLKVFGRDKGPTDTTSPEELEKLYKMGQGNK
jgi:DNA ligase-1